VDNSEAAGVDNDAAADLSPRSVLVRARARRTGISEQRRARRYLTPSLAAQKLRYPRTSYRHDRDKWRKYVHGGAANPRIEDG